VEAVDDGEFHVYRIDARHSLRYRLEPGDSIRSFLLIPSDTPDDRVEIDFVRFVLRREQYDRAPSGLTHETFEGELRPAVYAISPCDLRFEIAVPGGEPRLDFGMGILERGAPLRFSVLVEHGGGSTEIFEERIGEAERWRDARVDLSTWSGERIGLVLRVAGPEENVAFWASPRVTTRPKRRLFVLMILEDALRAGRLSLYGHERETSPFKERLASRGVLFEHAFSQATKTRPSCPSFMTSLYPTATGVWSFRDRLGDRYLTLAEILRSQGFETASFIQNTNAGPAAGLHQGFDHVWSADTMGALPQQIYGDQVLRWIARHRDRNLFVYLHVLDPHGVYDPPAPYDAWYREDHAGTEVRPLYKKIDPDWVPQPTREGRQRLYDGEILHNDARLESFVEALDRLGLLEDTLIVFMSDHGEHLGEHALWIHKPPGFVQVLHVPLLMVHPRLLPAGVRVSGPVQLADIAPSILELAGVEVERLPLQGRSLLPRVRGERPDRGEPEVAVSEEVMSYRNRQDPAVRASLFFGRWHLLHTEHQGRESLQIFDYLADPEEEKPLVSAYWDPLLQRRVLDWLRRLKAANLAVWESATRGGTEEVRFDPEVQDQLRALGYIE
jgi:arylsulfatase A-like enzyme